MAKGLTAYLEYLGANEEQRKRLHGVSAAELVKDAKAKGYEFTAAELEAAIANKRGKSGGGHSVTDTSIGWS